MEAAMVKPKAETPKRADENALSIEKLDGAAGGTLNLQLPRSTNPIVTSRDRALNS